MAMFLLNNGVLCQYLLNFHSRTLIVVMVTWSWRSSISHTTLDQFDLSLTSECSIVSRIRLLSLLLVFFRALESAPVSRSLARYCHMSASAWVSFFYGATYCSCPISLCLAVLRKLSIIFSTAHADAALYNIIASLFRQVLFHSRTP